MNRCSQCRKMNSELLTFWERWKNWWFHFLFSADIQDLSQDKYTQGFSDGFIRGRQSIQEDEERIRIKHGF